MAPLATIQQLADHLGVDVAALGTGNANQALAGASAAVRSDCHWQINQVLKDVMVRPGSGTSIILLPTGYVTQVWTVQLDSIFLSPVTWDGTTSGQYGFEWNEEGWLVRAPNWHWPAGERRVRVLLDHGYAVVPDDVVAVTCSVAARVLDNPESLKTRRVGELLEGYDGAALTAYQLSAGDRSLLADYRIDPGRF